MLVHTFALTLLPAEQIDKRTKDRRTKRGNLQTNSKVAAENKRRKKKQNDRKGCSEIFYFERLVKY